MLGIRHLNPNEWQQWRALRLQALADAPDAFSDTLAEALTRPDAHWIERTGDIPGQQRALLLACDDARPIGMAVIVIDPAAAARANLYAMWVHPSARRSGAGRALVEEAVDWARTRRVAEIVLGVIETNAPAQRLYQRVGFVETGCRDPVRAGSRLHTVEMVHRITSR